MDPDARSLVTLTIWTRITLAVCAVLASSCAPKFNFHSSLSSNEARLYGPAAQLVFSREPSSVTASGSEIPVQITIEDASGHVVTGGPDAGAQISLSLTSGSGPLNGTTIVSASSGVADFVFKGVNIATLGSGNVITATKADTSSSGGVGQITGASSAFDVANNNAYYAATATTQWLGTTGVPAAGRGDGMFDGPSSVFVDNSSNVYVVDSKNDRVMKFNSSGVYQGWIGWVGVTPTGGATGCTWTGTANVTPGWCTGGYGWMAFTGIWGDGTYLYVTGGSDFGSAIFRFDASTGAYMGWTGVYSGGAGSLSDTYTAGCSTLNGSVTPVATPGWCVGAESSGIHASKINGGFYEASEIVGDGTYLYVANSDSNDIQRVTASTGAAAGWIGNLGAVGGGGCGSATGSFVGSWCTDLSATPQASGLGDGSMNFNNGGSGVYYSSGNLFVADLENSRIDEYTATTGAFVGWTGMVGTTPTGGATGCSTTSPGNPTPGWCTGGSAQSTPSINGLYYPTSVSGDGTYLYVFDSSYRMVRYQISNGSFQGWIGGIGSSGTGGCGAVGTFTSSWCTLAGTQAQSGTGNGMLSEQVQGPFGQANGTWATGSVFYSSSTGSIWVADTGNNRISEYTTAGGFSGWSGAASSASAAWQAGSSLSAGAIDDDSFGQVVSGVFTDGTNLFVLDNNRIKNYQASTPTYVGWTGDVAGTPTSGASGCSSTASGSFTPGWCTGGSAQLGDVGLGGFSTWSSLDSQLFADGTYIYAVSPEQNGTQINRYDEASGAFAGWIGIVGSTPTGGDPGCTAASPGTATPGWCIGGSSSGSSASGGYNSVSGIWGDGTYLYISDGGWWNGGGNHRVNKVVSATGQFVGWIGAISTPPTGGSAGCSGASGITPGWCTGGTASGNDPSQDGALTRPWGITGDGTYIYVAISGGINRYNAANGAFQGWIGVIGTGGGSCTAGANNFTGGWCSGGIATNGGSADTIGAVDGAMGVYTDGDYLYVSNNSGYFISKYVLGTGAFVGWKGVVSTTPTGGDVGCSGAPAGSYTPGWCTGGGIQSESSNVTGGYSGFSGPLQISGAGSFLYVADPGNYRIQRLGK